MGSALFLDKWGQLYFYIEKITKIELTPFILTPFIYAYNFFAAKKQSC